jgi:hypothetical protein
MARHDADRLGEVSEVDLALRLVAADRGRARSTPPLR